ncbi:uncharacterized protein LOC111060105 isoform X2 [Nilaparvata lugens]|uniref:uncharacterized protein LOC111060105 isoform X2 n=1 Tax=Nilaparvata lugens TaxID=108931 RepID=UPI00193CF9AE|nr:uncharacterized protein LOC111060105 isoform X2 [Nilaparvata lugens]
MAQIQLLSYEVDGALPAIDVSPPTERAHVTCKLKKLQKEAERCSRIEKDNFTLLQHLSSIMHTSRVDNMWIEAPPNFSNKVGIYAAHPNRLQRVSPTTKLNPACSRKERCYGCSPQRIPQQMKIPEERIPWEPPRQSVSVKPSKTKEDSNKMKNLSRCEVDIPEFRGKKWSPPLSEPSANSSIKKSNSNSASSRSSNRKSSRPKSEKYTEKNLPNIETQSIVLSRGALHLAVNFPTHTTVILKDGSRQKVLQSEYCHCAAMPPTTPPPPPTK